MAIPLSNEVMMLDRTILIALGGAFALLISVLELVRRRRLREQYSILWLLTSLVVLVLASNRTLLDLLARSMKIAYPPSALFVIGFGFLLLITLHFSTVISRLTQENESLAQEMAILRQQIRELEKSEGETRIR
jgi:hypothetical protein